jgi:sulfatase maturation enzyme AslB (radical SAM superfamily)
MAELLKPLKPLLFKTKLASKSREKCKFNRPNLSIANNFQKNELFLTVKIVEKFHYLNQNQ